MPWALGIFDLIQLWGSHFWGVGEGPILGFWNIASHVVLGDHIPNGGVIFKFHCPCFWVIWIGPPKPWDFERLKMTNFFLCFLWFTLLGYLFIYHIPRRFSGANRPVGQSSRRCLTVRGPNLEQSWDQDAGQARQLGLGHQVLMVLFHWNQQGVSCERNNEKRGDSLC